MEEIVVATQQEPADTMVESSSTEVGTKSRMGRVPQDSDALDSHSPLVRKNVVLDQQSIDHLKELGGGELSAGIRMAARATEKK